MSNANKSPHAVECNLPNLELAIYCVLLAKWVKNDIFLMAIIEK